MDELRKITSSSILDSSLNVSVIGIKCIQFMYEFTQPLSHKQDMTQGQFLSGVQLI